MAAAAFRAGQCDALWTELDALLDEVRRPTDDGHGLTIPSLQQRTVRVLGEPGSPPEGRERTDTMAAEVPVSLVFNGIAHAVMMAPPQPVGPHRLRRVRCRKFRGAGPRHAAGARARVDRPRRPRHRAARL